MAHIVELSTTDCIHAASSLLGKMYSALGEKARGPIKLWGVPRGGISAAYLLVTLIPERVVVVDDPAEAHIAIDDIIDSGRTAAKIFEKWQIPTLALFGTSCFKNAVGIVKEDDSWLSFPWERTLDGKDHSAHDIVTRMLQHIGEDPARGGLLETPRRVVEAWGEWFKGYKENPSDHLKTFEDGAEKCDEMVLVSKIPVMSHCEHHITPFIGEAHVAYIPNGKIVGLSKIVRVVDGFSRRLQVQERLTNDIAECLWKGLDPLGVAVVVKATHFCMCTRGVKSPHTDTTTSKLFGVFKDKPEARAEFMSLISKDL